MKKSKSRKEKFYRTRYGVRVRIIGEPLSNGDVLTTRVKDGYRSYYDPATLVPEE